MRDASNSKRLLRNQKRTGIELEVIHGKVEADLIQQAEWQGNLSKDVDYLYKDVEEARNTHYIGNEVIQRSHLTLVPFGFLPIK